MEHFGDRHLDPPDEPSLWCPECGSDAEDCENPDEHEREWITYRERDYWDRADLGD